MKQDFIIITQPRSGDEILISQLRSHPNIYITLGKPIHDFLNQQSIKTFNDFLLDKYNKQNYEIKLREQDIMHSLNTRQFMEEYYDTYHKLVNASDSEKNTVKCFLDKIYSKSKIEKEEGYKAATSYAYTRYKINGLTAYIEDLYNNTFADILTTNTDIKVVFLFRKNLLFRYASHLLPVETNEHGYTKIVGSTVSIDKNNLYNDIEQRQAEQENIKQHVKKLGLETCEITYEDLVQKNRETLDRVQTFLNMPIQEKDLFGINVANIFEETRPLEVIIENYSNLKNECEEYIHYFEMAEQMANPFYYEIRKAGTFASLEFLKEMVDGMDRNLHDPYTNKLNIQTLTNTISGGVVGC